MEYVEGKQIDQYCSAGNLSTRERLELTAWGKSHPSTNGDASGLAQFHKSVGDHCGLVASSAETAATRQRSLWRRAREEYSRALAIWLELARNQPLEREYGENAQRLQQAIAKCDDALAKLGRPR
jgi:hypothetical protein